MNLNPAVRPRNDVTSWRSEARCEVADGELGKNSSAINGFDMNAFTSCVAIHKAIKVRKSQPARGYTTGRYYPKRKVNPN